MLKLLKKGSLIGLGLASLTREKVEELVDELVRRGEIAETGIPTRQQFDELIQRLERLEQATHSRKKPD